MTTSDYFNDVQQAIYSRRSLQKHLADLDDQMTSSGGFNYSPDKVQTSPKPQEERLCNMIDIKRAYEDRIVHLSKVILEAEDRLAKLSRAEYSEILRKLYMEDRRLTYFEIGQAMGYSEDWIKKLATDAFKEFEERWLNDNNNN